MVLENGQRGSPVEVPLDRFDAIDLSFDDTLAPLLFERPDHGGISAPNALDKAKQIRQAGLFGFEQPGVQSGTILLTHQRHERHDVLVQEQEVGAPLIQRRQETAIRARQFCWRCAAEPAQLSG